MMLLRQEIVRNLHITPTIRARELSEGEIRKRWLCLGKPMVKWGRSMKLIGHKIDLLIGTNGECIDK